MEESKKVSHYMDDLYDIYCAGGFPFFCISLMAGIYFMSIQIMVLGFLICLQSMYLSVKDGYV